MQRIDPIIEKPAGGKTEDNGMDNSNGHGNSSSNNHIQTENRRSLPVTDEAKFGLEGLTFDDVLLVPAYSEVLPTPDYISTSTVLTPNITLNVPIISAAM